VRQPRDHFDGVPGLTFEQRYRIVERVVHWSAHQQRSHTFRSVHQFSQR
jgi:hypothetical protein